MSFYAMPGLLCPPLHQQTSEVDAKSNSNYNRYKVRLDSMFVSPISNSGSNDDEPPQKVIVDFSKIEEADSSLRGTSWGSNRSSSNSPSPIAMTCHSVVTSSSHPRPRDLKINVKDASVNFNKLVRPHRYHQDVVAQRLASFKSRLQRRQDLPPTTTAITTTLSRLDSYEKAIEFDLVISCVGRTYSAKRSLQQVAQLRDDLLQEMALLQHWSERRLRKHLLQHLLLASTASSSSVLDDSYSMASTDLSSSSSSDDEDSPRFSAGTASFSSNHSMSSNSSVDGSYVTTVILPELPRLSNEQQWVSGVGVGGGGGFGRMNGLLHSYRIALEEWFRCVTNVVSDDSPVFANFLWEPLSGKCIDPLHAEMAKLGSIEE